MNALYYGVAAFCGLLPLYLARFPVPFTGGRLPTTALEVLFWALFAWWLVLRGHRADAWKAWRHWAVPLTVFVTGATVSLFVAPSLVAGLGLWRAYILEPLLFFAVVSDVTAHHKRGAAVLDALALTLSMVGAIAIYQTLTGDGIPNPVWQAAETRRATAFYGFPNAIGLFSAPVTVLMIAYTIELAARKGLQNGKAFLSGAAAALGAAGTLCAVSEGGAIGTAAGVGLLGLLDKKLRPWTLGAVIGACLVVLAVPQVMQYAMNVVSLSDDSGSVRRIVWGESVRMLDDHPVFGAGLAGYPARVAPYHDATWIEIFQYPHTIVMNFWSETGLIGLVGFVWICVTVFMIGSRLVKYGGKDAWLAAALMSAVAATLVHGLVDVPYFKNDLAFLFWILVGLVEGLRQGHETLAEKIAER